MADQDRTSASFLTLIRNFIYTVFTLFWSDTKSVSSPSSSSSSSSPLPQLVTETPPASTPSSHRFYTSPHENHSTLPSSSTPHPPPLHPITRIIRDEELGKYILKLAWTTMVPILLSVDATSKFLKPPTAAFAVTALLTGYASVWNGILLRETFPKVATGLEQGGIGILFLSQVSVLVAVLPTALETVVALLSLFFLFLPFLIAHLSQYKACRSWV